MSYNTIYQVVNPDGVNFGHYRSKYNAEKEIVRLNVNRVRRLMIQGNRMTGIKRGKNVEKWHNLVLEVANPFYAITEILLE